jgi:hypothetical protein
MLEHLFCGKMYSATRELVIARHVLFNNLLQFLRKPSALALASQRAVLQVGGFQLLSRRSGKGGNMNDNTTRGTIQERGGLWQ